MQLTKWTYFIVNCLLENLWKLTLLHYNVSNMEKKVMQYIFETAKS